MTRKEVGELYNDIHKTMRGWLVTQGLEPDQAEDVVQEAFVDLLSDPWRYRRRPRYEVEKWLWTRARGEVKDQHRTRERRFVAEVKHLLITEGQTPRVEALIESSNDAAAILPQSA